MYMYVFAYSFCMYIVGLPGTPQGCTVVNITSEEGCLLSINCKPPTSDVFGPVDHYIVTINGSNHTAYSTSVNISVDCGSMYTVDITAINCCGLEGSRVYVHVGTVNTTAPGKATAVHGERQCKLHCIYMCTCTCT